MAGARSHTELISWQLAHELKLEVYALIDGGPMTRHRDLCDQLRRSASNAPRNIAEGFGRYLPDDFARYLRFANGELKETFDALQDACDRRCLAHEDALRLQRLSKRASKAITNFIKYLKTATPPGEPPRRRRPPALSGGGSGGAGGAEGAGGLVPEVPKVPGEPQEPPRTRPSAPTEPMEPMD